MTQREFKGHIEKLQAAQKTKLGEVCDFCGQPPGSWVFLARPVVHRDTDSLPMEFSPEWCACPTCKDLIEADDRQALVERASEGYALSHITSDLPPEVRADREAHRIGLAHIHDIFFKNRVHEVRPILNRPENLRPN